MANHKLFFMAHQYDKDELRKCFCIYWYLLLLTCLLRLVMSDNLRDARVLNKQRSSVLMITSGVPSRLASPEVKLIKATSPFSLQGIVSLQCSWVWFY